MKSGKSGDKTSQPDGPCPECGRGVHKDGHHRISCEYRSVYAWGGADDDE